MSERTQCNYCTWQFLKTKYPEAKLRPDPDAVLRGATGVFVDGEIVAWFMELTDHCVC